MQSFQHETHAVDGDSDVAPARVHPGDPNYVMVPVRWLRSHRWMESPGHIIRLQDDVCLVGYSFGHLFGDLMHLCPTEIDSGLGGVWPMFVELVTNTSQGDFTSPSLHRVPDPDTFYTRSSEMTFVGLAVHRRPTVPSDEFGALVMARLYGLLDVCQRLEAELSACPPPVTVRRSRRLVPRPRRRSPGPTSTVVGCVGDLARRLHRSTRSMAPTPSGSG